MYKGEGGWDDPKGFLRLTLLRMNHNWSNFFLSKLDELEISGKLKNQIVLKMWGKERGKVEGLIGKLSQNALFSTFPPKFYS